MAGTVTLETHVTDVRGDCFCEHCMAWSAIEVDVAAVDPSTLTVLARATRWTCRTCDRSEVWRR